MQTNKQIQMTDAPVLLGLMKSPEKYYDSLSHSLTQTQAIKALAPTMGTICKIVSNGDLLVKALIAHALTDLNIFFNFQNIMTTPQIAQTVEMILSDFNWLKIEDVRVCLNNGKKGHYGQLYGRLDGQIIMLWFQTYSTDRTNEYLRIKDFNENQRLNRKIEASEINPEGQKKVIELLKSAIKNTNEVVEDKKAREKTDSEKLIQRFYRQFTKICINRNYDDSYRFIFMYGKVINANEYVEIKIKQYKRLTKNG